MRAGRELANVGEVEVLGYEKATLSLRCLPHGFVGATDQVFVMDRIDVKADRSQVSR